MLITELIKIILSKTEKIILVVFCLLFLIIVLFIGLLTDLFKNSQKKKGLLIDQELNGYVKYGFVKDPAGFKKVGNSKNQILFFKEAFIPIMIIIGSLILILVYCSVQKISFNYIWSVYYDMLLKIEWHWDYNSFIPHPLEWPYINTETSFTFHGDLNSIIAYLFLVLFIVGFIGLVISTCQYIAREKRIKEKAKVIFNESLDNFGMQNQNINNVNN